MGFGSGNGYCSGGPVAICSGTKKAQLHRNSLRVQVSSWHSALRFHELAKFARGHCDIGFCRGVVVRKTWRSSFINRHCDCCNSGCAGHATAALVTPPSLDQDDPASPFDVVLFFAIPGGSPTISATVGTTTGTAVAGLFFAVLRSRASASPTGFATVVPVAVALYFTSSRGTFPICSAVNCCTRSRGTSVTAWTVSSGI